MFGVMRGQLYMPGPVDNGIVADSGNSFDLTESHTVSVHSQTNLLNFMRIALLNLSFNKLTTASFTAVVLSALPMSIFLCLCGFTSRTFHNT